MANKRMFSMKIIDSDAFLEMPLSSQALYMHLNMRADDDGFVGNPKRISMLVGASEDDLKILIAKRFLIVFNNGVVVIKHWRMHNTLSKSRYQETQYLEEKRCLRLKENNAYTEGEGIEISDSKYIEMFKKKQLENKWRTSGEYLENADIGLDIDIGLEDDHNNKNYIINARACEEKLGTTYQYPDRLINLALHRIEKRKDQTEIKDMYQYIVEVAEQEEWPKIGSTEAKVFDFVPSDSLEKHKTDDLSD